MTTTESTAEPDDLPKITAWDIEGNPMFASDELDERYSNLLDKMGDAGSDALTFDLGVGGLVFSDFGIVHADEALEVMGALVERERLRRQAIDEELGLR